MSVSRMLVTMGSLLLTTMAMMMTVMMVVMVVILAAAAEGGVQTTTTAADLNSPINGSTWSQWEEPGFFSEEQALMHALVGHYENSVRPVYDANNSVDVRLGLTLTQILDLDEKNQVLTTNVWLEAEWYDQRLGWNSSDYGGISSIRIPCDRIWLPDIVLYNSVDDYTSGYMPSLAMVYKDSRVFWGPVIRFRSSCKIDITYFPFDDQICSLKIGSWAYNGFQVNVWNRSDTMDLSNLVDNGEWELVGVKVERNVVFYNCCDEPFPDVTFFVHLRRRVKYYFMNIIIPCIILSFLCLAGFLLPPESGEKITLGLSVLLTITVFMLMVADKMPQTSESISVISIYLMVVLATSCLSVLSSVWVLSIHHQRGQPRPVPSWLRFLIFSVVARLVCVSTATSYQRSVGRKTSREKGGRKKERKMPRSPRRSRVAMEEREYLRMEHRRTKRDPSSATPPPTQPLLHHPFTSPRDSPLPPGREGGWCGAEESEEQSPIPCLPRPFVYPTPPVGKSCSVCSGTGVVPRSPTRRKVWTQPPEQRRSCREKESTPPPGNRGVLLDTHTESEIPCEVRNLLLPRAAEANTVEYGGGGESSGRSEQESKFITNCAEDCTALVDKKGLTEGIQNVVSPQKIPSSQKTAEQSGDMSSQDSVTVPDLAARTSDILHEEHSSEQDVAQNVQSISSTETLYTRGNLRHLHSEEASPAKSTRENSQNESTPEKAESQDVWQKRDRREDLPQEHRLTFHTNTPTFSGMRNSIQPSGRRSEPATGASKVQNATSKPEHVHPHKSAGDSSQTAHNPAPDHRCCQCWCGSSTPAATVTTSASKDRAIIQRLMTLIQSKHGEEVKDEELYREWHDVACVLDRLLFYIFLIVTVVSSAVVLEMRPKDVHF